LTAADDSGAQFSMENIMFHKTNWCGHPSRLRDREEAPFSSLVAVTISVLKHSTVACGHALDRCCPGRDVEGAADSHCHPPEVAAALRPRCDPGSHNVSRPKALHITASLGACAREASFVHQHHLAALASLGSDEPRDNPADTQHSRGAGSNQGVLGNALLTRFHLVLPPLPVSSGRPVACSPSYKAHRKVLMAAASPRGVFRCAWIRWRTVGLSPKNSSRDWLPFCWLQWLQAGVLHKGCIELD